MDCFYSGQLSLSRSIVSSVIRTANLLGVDAVEKAAYDYFVEALEPSSACKAAAAVEVSVHRSTRRASKERRDSVGIGTKRADDEAREAWRALVDARRDHDTPKLTRGGGCSTMKFRPPGATAHRLKDEAYVAELPSSSNSRRVSAGACVRRRPM